MTNWYLWASTTKTIQTMAVSIWRILLLVQGYERWLASAILFRESKPARSPALARACRLTAVTLRFGEHGVLETKTVRLCPTDGNADIIAYCEGVDPNSIFDPATGRWYPGQAGNAESGHVIYDIYADHAYMVSHTNGDFNDFMFWVYSGRPPNVGNRTEEEPGEEEPPRWRSAAFVAASDGLVAFKARTGELDDNGVYINPIDGIYIRNAVAGTPIEALAVETGMLSGSTRPVDPRRALPIVGVGDGETASEETNSRSPHRWPTQKTTGAAFIWRIYSTGRPVICQRSKQNADRSRGLSVTWQMAASGMA